MAETEGFYGHRERVNGDVLFLRGISVRITAVIGDDRGRTLKKGILAFLRQRFSHVSFTTNLGHNFLTPQPIERPFKLEF